MKILIRMETEFNGVEVLVLSNNDERLVFKPVSDTIVNYLKDLPGNFRYERVKDEDGFTDSFMIYENS